jgi:hypothetical protein
MTGQQPLADDLGACKKHKGNLGSLAWILKALQKMSEAEPPRGALTYLSRKENIAYSTLSTWKKMLGEADANCCPSHAAYSLARGVH